MMHGAYSVRLIAQMYMVRPIVFSKYTTILYRSHCDIFKTLPTFPMLRFNRLLYKVMEVCRSVSYSDSHSVPNFMKFCQQPQKMSGARV